MLLEGCILRELGLQLLHDFTNRHSVVNKPVAWPEWAHHMPDRKGIDGYLGRESARKLQFHIQLGTDLNTRHLVLDQADHSGVSKLASVVFDDLKQRHIRVSEDRLSWILQGTTESLQSQSDLV